MDLYSRKILSFEISNNMDENFCIEAAKKAIKKYGAPKIIHTDRGKQFLGRRFRSLFEQEETLISIGYMGFKDNINIERFWRS